MNAVEIKNIYVKFEDNVVLEDVSLPVPEGEFLGIIGPNGGGKTTLLKIILGLIKPDSGSVEIFGSPISQNQHFVSYVPQYSVFDLTYPISVFDVVLTGRLNRKKILGSYNKEDKNIAMQSLELVGLVDLRERLVGSLSGGEKQRVLIARALAKQPKVLLLDEPTASIDAASGNNFYSILQNLNENMTIILVSHDIGAVSQNVKKIACLNRNLVFHDTKELTHEMVEAAYHCPVDLIAHGVAHRVLEKH
jgi:zinc transport system ATP-binding protein